MIRLFAAIPIPEEIAEALARREEPIQGVRWRAPEALHVTLRFFGELREDVADDLDAELGAVSGPALDLSLEGVGTFGEGGDLRVLWAGVAENPALRHLAARCETAARRAALKPEKRSFRPHVTLAYLRRPEPAKLAGWIQANNLLKSPPFRVDRFALVSSRLSPEGSSYRLEREYPLG